MTAARPSHVLSRFHSDWFAQTPSASGLLALAYFGEDRHWNIQVLDLRDGRTLRHYIAHRRRIMQLAYSPDGAWLVSVSADKAIRGWHMSPR